MNVHFFEYLMIMPYTIATWKLHFLCLRKLDYNLRQKKKKSKPGYEGDHFKPCSKSTVATVLQRELIEQSLPSH